MTSRIFRQGRHPFFASFHIFLFFSFLFCNLLSLSLFLSLFFLILFSLTSRRCLIPAPQLLPSQMPSSIRPWCSFLVLLAPFLFFVHSAHTNSVNTCLIPFFVFLFLFNNAFYWHTWMPLIWVCISAIRYLFIFLLSPPLSLKYTFLLPN